MFYCCLQPEITTKEEVKWYHREKKSEKPDRFYNLRAPGQEINHTKTHHTLSTASMHHVDNAVQPEKKPCSFYNQKALTREVDLLESQQKQILRLKRENAQLVREVEELRPYRLKYQQLLANMKNRERKKTK